MKTEMNREAPQTEITLSEDDVIAIASAACNDIAEFEEWLAEELRQDLIFIEVKELRHGWCRIYCETADLLTIAQFLEAQKA